MKKKKIITLIGVISCLIACIVFGIVAAAEQQFTEADRQIFGIFPIWLFLLIMAGIVMLLIIILVEIFKRKQK